MDGTTRRLAQYATGLRWEDLPAATVHEAKRRLIDTLGCAVGGWDGEPSRIVRRFAAARPGAFASRVLVDGVRAAPEVAALANTVQARYLDANDVYQAAIASSGHASDLVPGVLAACEAEGLSGLDTLLALTVGYELYGAIADRVGIRDRGWDSGLFVALGSAGGAGRAFGLPTEQMADALAIAVTAYVPTRQTRAGELSMWKGAATAVPGSGGVLAAQLARDGMTGPTAAFEGRDGIWQQVTGPFQLGPLGGEDDHSFVIAKTSMKSLAVEYHAQAPIEAALKLREQVAWQDIEAVKVRTYQAAYSEIGSEPAKWDPQTRETADHSLPYMLACAWQDGGISTATFDMRRVLDAGLRPLMQRIAVEEDPASTAVFPGRLMCTVEVVSKDGRRLSQTAGFPKGHVQNPLTDADVDAKFRGFCAPVLTPGRTEQALDALWHVDQAPAIGALLDLLMKE